MAMVMLTRTLYLNPSLVQPQGQTVAPPMCIAVMVVNEKARHKLFGDCLRRQQNQPKVPGTVGDEEEYDGFVYGSPFLVLVTFKDMGRQTTSVAVFNFVQCVQDGAVLLGPSIQWLKEVDGVFVKGEFLPFKSSTVEKLQRVGPWGKTVQFPSKDVCFADFDIATKGRWELQIAMANAFIQSTSGVQTCSRIEAEPCVQAQCTAAVQSGAEKAPQRAAALPHPGMQEEPLHFECAAPFDRDHPSVDIGAYDLSDWVVKEQKRVRFADAKPKHRRKKGLAPQVTIKKGSWSNVVAPVADTSTFDGGGDMYHVVQRPDTDSDWCPRSQDAATSNEEEDDDKQLPVDLSGEDSSNNHNHNQSMVMSTTCFLNVHICHALCLHMPCSVPGLRHWVTHKLCSKCLPSCCPHL